MIVILGGHVAFVMIISLLFPLIMKMIIFMDAQYVLRILYVGQVDILQAWGKVFCDLLDEGTILHLNHILQIQD